MIMFGEVTRIFGTSKFDHFFHPITISSFKSCQCQDHIFTWTIKTEKFKRIFRKITYCKLYVDKIFIYFDTYLAGNGKWIAFQGGNTFFFTTISFSQNTVTKRLPSRKACAEIALSWVLHNKCEILGWYWVSTSPPNWRITWK